MIYFDSSYLVRLYLDDPGYESVRNLASEAPVACSIHGRAEVVAALHRKLREKVFTAGEHRQIMDQFALDCAGAAYRWLPMSPSVLVRVEAVFRRLPFSVFLRAGDALHLACAAENRFREIWSNDARLLASAPHFGLRGRNVMGRP